MAYQRKRNYLTNTDDPFSDPELIATKYRVGKNAFFEVELALGELESYQSRSAGSSININEIQALYSGGVGFGPSCPWELENVWVNKDNTPCPVKAYELLKRPKSWDLYNPLSRNFNKLKSAELVENIPLYKLNLHSISMLPASIVSKSHCCIANTGNLNPSRCVINNEILVVKIDEMNCYQDKIHSFNFWKIGSVVKIELETEFIYMTGRTGEYATVAHNRKQEPDF